MLQTAIHPVFQGNNVILSGPQGCGKTMVLNLLRPEIRLAYWEAGEEFPVPKDLRNFVSAGINLTRSRITELVQVTFGGDLDQDFRELPLYFGDFFNHLIVRDLVDTIEKMAAHEEAFDSMIEPTELSKFATILAAQACWSGALAGVETLEHLKSRLDNRIEVYRDWVNGNLSKPTPPDSIRESKTTIGEPISRTADALRESGVIKAETPVLIRIDQIEELHRAFTDRQSSLLLSFRKVINRVFYLRDERVNYRAGTRRYGWDNPEFLTVWGSESRLENRRNYQKIEMDRDLFLLGEANSRKKNSVFERFMIDAFQRRVSFFYDHDEVAGELPEALARSVFGDSPNAEGRLVQLRKKLKNEQIDRVLGLDLAADGGEWSDEWRSFLREKYRSGLSGMVDATLAAAWGRQTGGAHFKDQHRENPPPENEPWRSRNWWRKERLDHAVLQLSVRCQQRFVWWGFDDIKSLCGGNITVFLHVCHRIWDGFLKNESSLLLEERTELFEGKSINKDIQSAGILFASNEWFNKLPEEPGGNARQNFVERLGSHLNEKMTKDLPMSYPGGNGISLRLIDYNSEDPSITALRDFMREAVGFGALFSFEHASKRKSDGRRIKYYLNPILCPRFQLPEARTKEPYYWSVNELFEILNKAKVTLKSPPNQKRKQAEIGPLLPGFSEQD